MIDASDIEKYLGRVKEMIIEDSAKPDMVYISKAEIRRLHAENPKLRQDLKDFLANDTWPEHTVILMAHGFFEVVE